MLKLMLLIASMNTIVKDETEIIISPARPVIDKEMVFEFQNPHLTQADSLQINYNSEYFQIPEPGKNLLSQEGFPADFYCEHVEKNPKRRSRTRVGFICSTENKTPFSPRQIYFHSIAPPSAMDYSIEMKLELAGQEIAHEKNSFPVSPDNSVFITCQLLERKGALLSCRALDKRGNLAENPVTISGELPGILPLTQYNFNGSLDIKLSERPKPEQRFQYTWQNHPFVSNALPEKNRPVFFGDIHMHSMFSDAYVPATPADLFAYVRNVALLDFAAVTDHAEGVWGEPINEEKIELTRKMVHEWHNPPFFTTFFGFEWTHSFEKPDSIWGHRNIIYPDTEGKFFRSDLPEYDSPARLYRHTGPALSFIHHSMMPWGDFKWNQPVQLHYERGVEIFSAHGSSEGPPYITKDLPKNDDPSLEGSLRNMIKSGLNLPFMASSDSHSGHPGVNDWHYLVQPARIDGGGLIAVFTPLNSRNPLFDAIYRQNFYATSGTRILLYPESRNQPFPLRIHGTHELSHAEIFHFYPDGTEEVEYIELKGKLDATINTVKNNKKSTFYIRITQTDDEKAWIGPWQK